MIIYDPNHSQRFRYFEVTADVDGWFRYPEWNSFIVKWQLSCIYIDSRHVSLYHVFSIEICHVWRWLRPRNSKTNLKPPHELLLGRLYIYQLHITQFPSHLVWHLNLGKPRVRWFHIKGVFFWNTVYFKRIKSRNFMFLFVLLVGVLQDKMCLKAKLYLSNNVISPRAGNFFQLLQGFPVNQWSISSLDWKSLVFVLFLKGFLLSDFNHCKLPKIHRYAATGSLDPIPIHSCCNWRIWASSLMPFLPCRETWSEPMINMTEVSTWMDDFSYS